VIHAATRLGGIWAAALTPLDAQLHPELREAIAYYRDLLAAGCDGINLLGTTGEAMSFGLDQRRRLMESIARSDLPLARVMVGTGAASLDDAAQLTRLAFELGFAAALVLPPFFYRDARDEGVVRFFDELLDRAHSPGKRILLYNFPQMSGVTFHVELVDRLAAEFPGAIVGLKDSSNDAALQRDVVQRHPEWSVFPSSESDLVAAKAYGAAGCISGSVALWGKIAADAFHRGDEAAAARAGALRAALAGPPLIPAMRYLTAKARDEDAWRRSLPPIVALTDEEGAALDARLAQVR
jgi:4-hydroxy-tetrahydrodipicolinate synthase